MCKKGTCTTCRKQHLSLLLMTGSLLQSPKMLTGTAILEKTSWWGCGNHVPSIMDKVPVEERCTCEPKIEKEGKEYPPMAAKAD